MRKAHLRKLTMAELLRILKNLPTWRKHARGQIAKRIEVLQMLHLRKAKAEAMMRRTRHGFGQR